MASKKSIRNLLPIVASDKDSSDFPCRFNRHIPGDYLGTEQQGNNKDTKQDLCEKLENNEKSKQLIPPAGVPLTAEELMKLKKSQPGAVVDYCKPVQYQFQPINDKDPDCIDPGVVSCYPSDPCFRPNEGDLACPLEHPPLPVNHPRMPTAGSDTRMLSDVFRFYKVYEPTACNSCGYPYPCSCVPGPEKLRCGHINKPRYPPSKSSRHFEFRYPSGPAQCSQEAHRHGHVPHDCKKTYPGPDEINYLDQPRPSDCQICLSNGRVYTGQPFQQGDVNFPEAGCPPTQISSKPRFMSHPVGLHYPVAETANRCDDSTMYNNFGSVCTQTDPEEYNGRVCNPSTHPFSGNPQYNGRRFVNRGTVNGTCPGCTRKYFTRKPSCSFVYNRNYLAECPEQDGPPANTYTFL